MRIGIAKITRFLVILFLAITIITGCKKDSFPKYSTPITGADTIDFSINAVNCRLITPQSYKYLGEPNKLVIYFHPRAGNYAQTLQPAFMDSLLAHGYSIATTTAESLWGNGEHQQRYIRLYDHLQDKFNYQKEVIIFSLSMGSIAAMNIVDGNKIPVFKFISIAGVVSINDYYLNTLPPAVTDIDLDIQNAYKFSSPVYASQAMLGFDPYTRIKISNGDSTYYPKVPIYFLHGSLDTVSAKISLTRRLYRAMARKSPSVNLKEEPLFGHDVNIETPENIHSILGWINK